MISDTRGFWHADTIRSAAARPREAKSATGVFGLVLTTWRLASTDAGRNEALGLHELECRRLQAGTLGIRGILLLGNGSRRRVPCCPWLESHHALERPQGNQCKKQIFGRAATRLTKAVPWK